MKHWSVDIRELRKDRRAYDIWSLEQRINFGIGKKKINKKKLKKYWSALDLDPKKKQGLAFLLWGKQP